MKIKVKITGLECPNCARTLQKQLNKLDDVQNAEIDFMKSTLVFESAAPKDALEKIVRLTARLEPQAKIVADKNLFQNLPEIAAETSAEESAENATENTNRTAEKSAETAIENTNRTAENINEAATENTNRTAENTDEAATENMNKTAAENTGKTANKHKDTTATENANNTTANNTNKAAAYVTKVSQESGKNQSKKEKNQLKRKKNQFRGEANQSKSEANQSKSEKNQRLKNVAQDVVTLVCGIAIAIFIFFFPLPMWVYWTLYAVAALLLGYKTYFKAAKLLLRGVINENLLITISVVGASIISQHMEGLMVIALYTIGKIFEGLAVDRSRANIEKLVRMQPEYANLLQNGAQKRVLPSQVAVGSTILVHAGEKIPLDGIVEKGQCLVDNQSLSGESVPVKRQVGDEILSGGIVLDGTLQIRTTSTYQNSAIAKIMDLVENATENKSKTETFISRLTRWYTLGVVLCAVLVWGIVWSATGNLETAFYRGLIFLVVSCPCAFAISVPLAYFAGLGNASKNGVLIKGSNFLDACASLRMVAFDKTGTLTTGNFEIVSISAQNGFDKNEILQIAAIGEKNSLHPLAKAICAAWENEEKCLDYKATNLKIANCENEVLGCENKVLDGENKANFEGKAANCGCKANTLNSADSNWLKNTNVENFREIAGQGVQFNLGKDVFFVGRKSENLKATTVEVLKSNTLIGKIELSDTIKPQSFSALRGLQQIGVKSALLSGDNQETASAVAKKLEINTVMSGLLPQQKFEYLQNCKQQKLRVGYVGDGINDAPSLAVADVGFSMGINGAPASIEASDIVIVDDNPQKIVTAIKLSRFTRKIVWENILLSAIIKITFLALGAAGITGMLAAVFADVGVTLLAILNSLRALQHKAK